MPYAQAGDLRIYYEFYGQARLSADSGDDPLVLLNGALDTIESDWGKHLPAFAARYHVLAYDHRGHGRTSASPGRFSGYDLLAGDLEALLDTLGIARARFCGFSDGGITLLYFALRRPERVRSLILAGAQYTNDDRTLALLAKMTPERISARLPEWADRLAQLHDTHHEPGYWRQLIGQMLPMWPTQPDLALDQLAEIGAPTLLIAGERDGFGHIDQQVAMRRAMPRAELCILPAAGHDVLNDQPELFRLAALDFLERKNALAVK
jgi:pimeloyl-ACP methyl ester carboxylesterase